MLLFVYGSLKRGFSNHHRLAHTKFIGEAVTLSTYAMWGYGFPIVAKRRAPRGHKVNGELYQVDAATLRSCDQLEGHPHWYIRRKVKVQLADGTIRITWMYLQKLRECKQDLLIPYIGHSGEAILNWERV
jgi:gamma-glutamylaminecyclotransferase